MYAIRSYYVIAFKSRSAATRYRAGPDRYGDAFLPVVFNTSIVVQETLEPLGTRRVTELAQRFCLDLPYPLARHIELLADLFQGVVSYNFV